MGEFTYLFALNPSRRRILKFRVADASSVELVGDVDAFPDGIVVDRERGLLYWTNMGGPRLIHEGGPLEESNFDFYVRNGSIERVALDGSDRAQVLREGSFVTGKQLAGAWSRGRLYWSDREGAAVRSAALDGSELRDEVLVATTEAECHVVQNQCVGVAVDEDGGFLYWTQKGPSKGGEGLILRTSLDIPEGQSPAAREVEVLWSGLPEPVDLELDVESGTLYWTDRGAPPSGNTLNKAAIPPKGEPGGEITVLSSGLHEAIGLVVDKEAAVAYVSDLSGEIRAVRLDRSGEHVFAKVDGLLTGIAGL